jgi:hypothetical protein
MGADSSANSEDTGGADNAQNLESTRLVNLASALDKFSHGEYTNNFKPDPLDTNESGPGTVVQTGYAPTITNTRANAPTETT